MSGFLNDTHRRKRLLYRAMHRGFKEADLVVGGFAAAHLAEMTIEELDEFEALLALPDHDLYAFLKGGREPQANLVGPVFQKMRAFDVAAITAPR
ncbi:MAG: succinate dehydrogenase assembly factor 2 [Parvularculaceae bacterium]|nr:succinate dehydrogenase assembly factor 2 [Parvularculaceae bacterium]